MPASFLSAAEVALPPGKRSAKLSTAGRHHLSQLAVAREKWKSIYSRSRESHFNIDQKNKVENPVSSSPSAAKPPVNASPSPVRPRLSNSTPLKGVRSSKRASHVKPSFEDQGQSEDLFSAPSGHGAGTTPRSSLSGLIVEGDKELQEPVLDTRAIMASFGLLSAVSLLQTSFPLSLITPQQAKATTGSVKELQEIIQEDFSVKLEHGVCVDRFGFYLSLEEMAAECDFIKMERDFLRQMRWKERLVVPRWSSIDQDERKKLCREGIPSAYRKVIWLRLLGVSELSTESMQVFSSSFSTASSSEAVTSSKYVAMNEAQKIAYLEYITASGTPLSDEEEQKYGSIIEKDLPRTFSTNFFFDSESSISRGQAPLRRILRAYCHRDKLVGYCQGMASLAATLLLVMEDEYDAYLCLCALMEKAPYNLKQYYAPGFPELQRSMFVLEGLMESTMGNVARLLKKKDIIPSMYAMSWLLTLFSHCFNFRLLCRIWDMFLCEGWKPVFRIVLALLKMEQSHLERLQKTDVGGIVVALQHAPEEKDPFIILKTALDISFTTKQMNKLRESYRL